jgi:hypothetical protein
MYSKTVLAFAIMCIIAIIACTDQSVDPVGPYIQTFVVKDSVEYAFEVNGNVFASHDTVRMFFLVTNLSNKTVEFGAFNKCYACGFAVRYGRLDIWQSCREPPPCGVLGDNLMPGEARLFGCDWNTISDNGTFFERDDDYPVPPGAYTVIASPGMARAEQVELLLTIHIVP